MAKVLQNRAAEDEQKMSNLADELKKAQARAEDADRKYDEAQKKMAEAEAKLDIDGERADVSEYKIIELEEELKVVANNLKSLEVSEDKANKREDFYKTEIKRLTGKLKQSETRAEFAEKSVGKLQKEVSFILLEKKRFKLVSNRLTDWRMSCWVSRTSSKPSQRSLMPPSPRCPDTRNPMSIKSEYCCQIKTLFSHPMVDHHKK